MLPSRGFTLTEILVTLAIIAILVLLVVCACVALTRMVSSLKQQVENRAMAAPHSMVVT